LSPPKLPNQPARPGVRGENGRPSLDQDGSETRPHIVSATTDIPFRDPESSRLSLERASSRFSAALGSALRSLLAEAPDPDGALLQFERLSESPEVVQLLERHNFLAHYAIVVFGHSRFLGETLLQNLDLLPSLLREKNLDRSFSQEEFHESLARFRARSLENDVSLILARFKRREYVRIMLRDVLKIAPLAETTAEISALADVLIEEALREADSHLQRRHGTPQHVDALGRLVDTPFAILALGKLGGNELNYSSDVDLMYIYGDGDEPAKAPISNREYFIRLAQHTTEILSRVTREGLVFRIDLRLRPQGGEGELAIRLSQALSYYSETAHDWERQALIKAKYSAGDAGLAREFIRAVQPHVYTEKVNFAAIKTALVAREKMQKRWQQQQVTLRAQPGQTFDVKVDRGGIRDIEFLVQCLQRVYGGAEPWLRSGGTLFSLQKLHDKRHISGKEFHDLTSAYEFLRHLEHRLQLRDGRQTHRLPAADTDLKTLQRAMEGYAPSEYRVTDLASTLKHRMGAVAEIYQRIIFQQQTRGHQQARGAEFKLLSPPEPTALDQSSQHLLERLVTDAPAWYEIANRPDLSQQARRSFQRFLASAFTSSHRYATLARYQKEASRALSLFEASDYLTEILIRHPEEIATLAETEEGGRDPGRAYLFERAFPEQAFGERSLVDASSVESPRVESSGRERAVLPKDPTFTYLAYSPVPYSEKLALLRQHFRHRAFVVGARDVIELRDVYESFADITAAAADAMAAAFSIAGAPQGLAVMALGRLGSGEFDLLSDADVLFVCEEEGDRIALTKCAERMMHVLSDYTRDSMVFPVDARLRPRGSEGELLVTPTQLAAYFEHEAQPWEALMYTKLRFFAGWKTLGDRATAQIKILFDRFAADAGFGVAVREMRTKLEGAETRTSFKSSPGGTYDIDFITSYLMVKHGVSSKRGSLRDRLWRCVSAGRLDKGDAASLDHAAELLRTAEHVSRLVVGRPGKWLPATEHGRQVTERLTGKILSREFPDGLETELARTLGTVRTIYDRIFDDDGE
jgi:[glutamine synthetase] adenylyltransferase / [glutamine synthetase]-adenylyl-L-tyrosine phosphorylase